MNCALGVCLIVANLIRTALVQSSSGSECCSVYIMDSRGRVVMETRRQLTSGTYVALKVRVCSADPIAVQIWRLTGNGTLSFRWQTIVSPVLSTSTQTFVTVNFAAGLVLTSDDRLGLFSPFDSSTNMSILSIPFGFDENNYYLYYSTATFSSFSDFNDLVQVTADDLRWPRSFVGSVLFCQQSDCSDVTAQSSAMTSSPYTSTRATTNECCPNPISCDPSGLDGPLSNQTRSLQDLNQEIDDITSMIRDLLSSRVVTGLCPQGFTPGTYGVGKCFLLIRSSVPMASAALQCQTDYSALLIQIKSIAEESFLRSFLSGISNSGELSFWTAGMFNRDSSKWFWYDESRRVKSPITYTNWKDRVSPVPTMESDVCMKLVVTQGVKNSSYWMKSDCNENNFFVCQIYKTCL